MVMHFTWGRSHVKCRNGHLDRNLVSLLSGTTPGCWDAVHLSIPNVPVVNFGKALDPITTCVLAGISHPGKWGYRRGALTGWGGTEHGSSVADTKPFCYTVELSISCLIGNRRRKKSLQHCVCILLGSS